MRRRRQANDFTVVLSWIPACNGALRFCTFAANCLQLAVKCHQFHAFGRQCGRGLAASQRRSGVTSAASGQGQNRNSTARFRRFAQEDGFPISRRHGVWGWAGDCQASRVLHADRWVSVQRGNVRVAIVVAATYSLGGSQGSGRRTSGGQPHDVIMLAGFASVG